MDIPYLLDSSWRSVSRELPKSQDLHQRHDRFWKDRSRSLPQRPAESRTFIVAKIRRTKYPEIRWFDVQLTDAASKSGVFKRLPERSPAFRWHGGTFDLPPGATWIAESDACRNQAFEYGGRGRGRGGGIGLQFHLDMTLASIRRLVGHCGDELIPGECSGARGMLAGQRVRLADLYGCSSMLLDWIVGEYGVYSKALPVTEC